MESAINEWYATVSGIEPTQAKSMSNNHDDGPKSIRDLVEFYDRCALQQLTSDTLVAELMKDAIVWVDQQGNELVGETIPMWVPSIVAETVRVLLVCGWVIWRITPLGMIQIAHPQEMTIEYDPSKAEWVPVALSPHVDDITGWVVSFSAMPMPSMTLNHSAQRVTIKHMRSAAKRSWYECHRVMQIERHWLTRDRHNSAPAVFTHVTSALNLPQGRGPTGASLASSHGPQFGMPGVGDFNDLIHRRAAKRAMMEDLSEQDKGRIQAQTQFAGYELTTDTAAHAEHIITDGRHHNEAKSLISLADSGYVYNRSRHNALMLMGCPPQALGESVNSERTAANHAQYATALATFKSTVDLYRAVLQQILAGGDSNSERHMAFKRCLSRDDLSKILPVLKTEAAVDMFACTYMVPTDIIDFDRMQTFQDAGGQPQKNVSERTLRNRAVEKPAV